MIEKNSSVLKNWLSKLSWRQQSVVISAIRGCDGLPKDDPSKVFVRKMRATILNDANSNNTYMCHSLVLNEDRQLIDKFFIDCSRGGLDAYPVHWLIHFLHAAEIVGYEYPDTLVGGYWYAFYLKGVSALHMNPETEKQLDIRLS